MEINNNCVQCGRLITIDNRYDDIFVCPYCETIMKLEYEITIDEDGIEKDVLVLVKKE